MIPAVPPTGVDAPAWVPFALIASGIALLAFAWLLHTSRHRPQPPRYAPRHRRQEARR